MTLPSNPKQIQGDKKPPLHLVPPAASIYISLGLWDGAYLKDVPYGPFNWRESDVETMTYVGALKRHIDLYVDGETIDPKSGKPHLAHAIAGLAILIDAIEGGFAIDNRPPAGGAAKLIEKYTLGDGPQSAADDFVSTVKGMAADVIGAKS